MRWRRYLGIGAARVARTASVVVPALATIAWAGSPLFETRLACKAGSVAWVAGQFQFVSGSPDPYSIMAASVAASKRATFVWWPKQWAHWPEAEDQFTAVVLPGWLFAIALLIVGYAVRRLVRRPTGRTVINGRNALLIMIGVSSLVWLLSSTNSSSVVVSSLALNWSRGTMSLLTHRVAFPGVRLSLMRDDPAERGFCLFPWGLSSGRRGSSLSVPGWLLPAGLLIVALRDSRRSPERSCSHCGYNMTGNTSGRCPECGFLWIDP